MSRNVWAALTAPNFVAVAGLPFTLAWWPSAWLFWTVYGALIATLLVLIGISIMETS